jgi:hypothetical protein
MLFMNRWDIAEAMDRFRRTQTPTLYHAATILHRLQQWTDEHSDGWAYWPKPCRAAKALMTVIQAADHGHPEDITAAQLKKACQPIRTFLTRQGANPTEIIGER